MNTKLETIKRLDQLSMAVENLLPLDPTEEMEADFHRGVVEILETNIRQLRDLIGRWDD